MPVSFDVLGVRKDPDDIMVSRMSAPKPKPALRMPMRRRMATSANQMFFAPTSIEETMRRRQELQHSASDPVLGSTRSKPMLPRIGTSRATGRLDESSGRTGPALIDPFWGSGHDLSRWDATSTDGKHRGNVGGVTLVASPMPGNSNAWCGLLGGDYRIQVPFGEFSEDDHERDSDAFLRWFSQREAHRGAEASRNRCSRPEPELLPWSSERDVALIQLKGNDVEAGRALRLQAKADLFDFLQFSSPLRGLDAMIEAISFRLGGLENIMTAFDCNGTRKLGLMEFAGSLSLLGVDSQIIVGIDDHDLFLGLDRDSDGLIKLRNFHRLAAAVKPNKYKPRKGDEPVLLQEVRLQAPQEDPPEVSKAKTKWAHIARWMSAAFQRSIALRTERLLHGWRVQQKAGAKNDEIGDEFGDDTTVGDDFFSATTTSLAATEGAASTPMSPMSPWEQPHEDESSEPQPPPRRRLETSTPRELTLESLATMREQELSLKALFNAAASQQLPDGTPEMTRADLHAFFQDLLWADAARHARVSAKLLDNLYDEAIALQCNFTRIGNGLTFWSMKVLLNNIIGPLGLNWRRIVETHLCPQSLHDAARAAEELPKPR